MAVRILIICDVHGEKPCPKGAEVESREIFDMFTGKKYKKDLCGPEWDKLSDAQEKIMYGTEPVREEVSAQTPAKSNGSSKPKSNGAPRKPRETYQEWAKLLDATKNYWVGKYQESPRGQVTPHGKAATEFLASPEGEKWKDWKPGMPIPK